MKYVLLSHGINENTPLYGNTPKPRILPHSRISEGDSSNTAILSIHNHTGTHIDAPKHFVDDGKAISEYTLDELVFKYPVIVDCPKDGASLITPEDLQHTSHMLQKSDCLLLRTGFGQLRDEERYRTHNPGISPETIRWIRRQYPDIRCIGIDTISISSFQHRVVGREAHKEAFLIQKDMGGPLLLIEDMDLDLISDAITEMRVLPWQVNGLDSAPCHVIAIIEDDA
ncbi:MAG: cyclase family protein [Candidatus Heimdallarchaeota archaeon]|nr:cyclase family protein [Candidatus Heimdallarchaeota archaeon]